MFHFISQTFENTFFSKLKQEDWNIHYNFLLSFLLWYKHLQHSEKSVVKAMDFVIRTYLVLCNYLSQVNLSQCCGCEK